MAAHRKYDYATKPKEILARLRAQKVPFLALAAEYCGVPRKTCRSWMNEALHRPEHELHEFALEVRRIQADWIDRNLETLIKIAPDDKQAAVRANQLQWVLARLDGETFDPTQFAKRDAELETSTSSAQYGRVTHTKTYPTPQPASADEVAAATAELEKPLN